MDGLIGEIRERWHGPVFEGVVGVGKEQGEKGEGEKKGEGKEEGVRGDVVIVAHGHILRAFAQRWVGKRLEEGVGLLLDGMFFSGFVLTFFRRFVLSFAFLLTWAFYSFSCLAWLTYAGVFLPIEQLVG